MLTVFVSAATADTDRGGNFMVFMETARGCPNEIRMELETIRLIGKTGTFDLDLVRSVFTSTDDAGQTFIVCETPIPPGHYDEMRLMVRAIMQVSPDAETAVPVVPEGIVVPISTVVADNEAVPIFLQWLPHADAAYPDIRITHPPIPPLGSLAFVTLETSGAISVVDRYAMKVVDIIEVGSEPRGMAYSSQTQELFVALADQDAIAIIDATSLNMVQTIPMRFGDDPDRMHLSGDGDMLYVILRGANSLAAINIRSHQETGRISLGMTPAAITSEAFTGAVYVSNALSDNISVYDPVSDGVTLTFSSDGSPGEIWANEGTTSLYLTYPDQRYLSVIDTRTGARTATMNLCAPATGLAFNRVTRLLMVSQGRCSEIALLRPEQNIDLGGIHVPAEPGLLAIDPENRNLLVVLPTKSSLAFVNLNSRQVMAVIEVGRRPYMAVIPE